MSNTKEWWNDFWVRQGHEDVPAADDRLTYSDLVWKIAHEYWYERFEKFAPGKKMLEGGCGSAKVSQYMAQHGYECTLLDYSKTGLNLAKSNFASLGLEAQFVTGDLNQLCFNDGEFDVVYSGGVLEFFDDVRKPIQEMVRVLKPGGFFAANMVPRKFSIQTIADVERTIACAVMNLFRGRFKNVFKVVRNVPKNYSLHSLPLGKYVKICEKAGLRSIVAAVTSPFPILALPAFMEKAYVGMMKRLLPQWRRFNESNNWWSRMWGITYAIYGIKK